MLALGMRMVCVATLVLTLPAVSMAQGKVVRGRHFYDSELTVRPGDLWFGLLQSAGAWRLSSLRVRAVVRDTVCGPEFTVDFGTGNAALFLVRGVPALTAGSVSTLDTTRHMLRPGQSYQFSYRAVRYALVATGSDSLRPRDYRLLLERPSDGRRQMLVANSVPPSGVGIAWPPRIEWIGDLDRDGRPDFLIDLHMYETPDHWALFLSSAAGATQLVTMVADHARMGC